MKLHEIRVGDKIRRDDWDADGTFVKVLFVGFTGVLVETDELDETFIHQSHLLKYREFKEPKKKITKWLWATEDGLDVTDSFHVKGLETYPVKLEWSATEFEVNE